MGALGSNESLKLHPKLALTTPVVYFDQGLGAAHPKHWPKYELLMFLTFLMFLAFLMAKSKY